MAGGDDMRFSDMQLSELRQDFNKLVEVVDSHVETFKNHEIREDAWREDLIHRDEQQNRRFDALMQSQEKNTYAIAELTSQVSAVVNDTKDIVQLHKDFQGAARVGKGVQDLMLWLMKWGTIGGALAASVHYIVTHMKH